MLQTLYIIQTSHEPEGEDQKFLRNYSRGIRGPSGHWGIAAHIMHSIEELEAVTFFFFLTVYAISTSSNPEQI